MNITEVAHELQGDATSQPWGYKRGDWSHRWSAYSTR